MTNYPVVLPVLEHGVVAFTIDRGSGIIVSAGPNESGYVELYYEGNRYGACNIRTFADRVYHAADRASTRYPTIATMAAKQAEVVQIGEFDGTTVSLAADRERALLETWLGGPFDDAELQVTR